jgi:phosphatidylserine/phosphatidylglycerophosphate/cardiolipin synthase-like enzyme
MDTPIQKNELVLNSEYIKKIIPLIDGASRSIYCFMFEWRWDMGSSSSEISLLNSAFIRAVQRGVGVNVLSNFGEILDRLNDAGAECRMYSGTGNMHAKCLVIDGEIIVLGSHNFSQNSFSKNVEISTVFQDKTLAKRIIDYFIILWRQ